MNFLNQQISLIDAMALDRLVQEVARPGMRVFELGSFTGRSSLAMLPYIHQQRGKLTCVDWFQGNEGLADEVALTQGYANHNVLDIFRSNLTEAGFAESVNIVVGTTQEVAPTVQDGCADMVFIDADHRYTGVRQDIIDWWPKVKEGGIVCGHDFECPLSACDEAEAMANCEIDFVNGRHYGVIRAVSEFFPDAKKEGVVWWVRKVTGAYPVLEAALAEAKGKVQVLEARPELGQLFILSQFLNHSDPVSIHHQARLALASGDLLNACRGASALNHRFPQYVEGWLLMVDVCEQSGEPEVAFNALKDALKAVGEHPLLMQRLGEVAQAQGELGLAEEAYRTAVALPQDALLQLAQVLCQSGKHDEALDYLRMAVRLNPLDLLARVMMADCARHQGEEALAQASLQAAREIDPDSLAVAKLERSFQLAS